MTQTPGTWNPLISSMLAKSLISNMTARPLTAYDADWKLVCLVCTELPTIENGKARVIDLPDGKKGMEVDVELRDLRWGDGTPVTAKDVAFTLEVGKHPLSGVASSEGYKRIIKLDVKDDRRFTMTIDRVTFDYNSIGFQLLPAHIEKPIFDANPGRVPQQDGLRHRLDQSRPRLRSLPHRRDRAGQPHRPRAEPDLDGREAVLQAHRRQDHREHGRARGQPSVGQCRLRAGRARPLARPGARLREAPQGQVQRRLQAGADLRAHRRHLDNKLLADRRVRQAILLAIDRKAISEKLFEGKQPIAARRRSARSTRCSARQRRHYGYDPAAAPQAARRGGLRRPSGTACATTPPGERLSHRAHHHRRQPGARAGGAGDPEPAPPGRHRRPHQGRAAARLLRGDEPPAASAASACTPGCSGRRACRARSLHSKEIPTAENAWSGQNYPGYRNPEMDKRARRRRARARRRQAPRPVRRDPAHRTPTTCRSLPLFFRVDPFVIPKPLKGVTPTGTSQQLDPVGRAVALGELGARQCGGTPGRMSRYLASRAVQTVVTLALMSFVVYLLIGLMPGDPIDMMIAGDPNMTQRGRRPAARRLRPRQAAARALRGLGLRRRCRATSATRAPTASRCWPCCGRGSLNTLRPGRARLRARASPSRCRSASGRRRGRAAASTT